jgi:ankyrin repeat protein
MAPRNLPHQSNLEQLKKQAKDLLKAYRARDADALADFSVHPQEVSSEAAKLTDAQLVLSRQYGFDSWPKLRKEVAGRQLRSAIWDRDLTSLKKALETEPQTLNEAGPHPRWGGQPTPIQIAAERGEIDVVRLLLDEGANPDAGDEKYGWSALQLAAHWGHRNIVDLLIDRGADVDIFTCALMDDVERASDLLNKKPSLATTSGLNDAPPLHLASSSAMARLLVERGSPLDTRDSNGNDPLSSAVGRDQLEVVHTLTDMGCHVDPCMMAALGWVDHLHALLDEDQSIAHFTGQIGLIAVVGTPLHAAAHHDQVEPAQLLLSVGADPNARADQGQSPLHLASSVAVASALVDAGADPDAVDDEHGTTPLAWANISIDIHGSASSREELVAYLEDVTTKS